MIYESGIVESKRYLLAGLAACKGWRGRERVCRCLMCHLASKGLMMIMMMTMMILMTTLLCILLQLKEGTLVQVPPSLVKRCKTHFLNLPCGATVILGNNGYVWISPFDNEEATLADGQTGRLANGDTATKEVIIDNEQDI